MDAPACRLFEVTANGLVGFERPDDRCKDLRAQLHVPRLVDAVYVAEARSDREMSERREEFVGPEHVRGLRVELGVVGRVVELATDSVFLAAGHSELDLDALVVSAQPLVPDAPDGATRVKIGYTARDDKSGLGRVSYKLRDPNGNEHFSYHYHENFHTGHFKGDPTRWKEYTLTKILPKGSAPGTWGLQLLEISDKAGNTRKESFVEVMRFDVMSEQ